jgi:hypothetical protein
MDEQYRALFGGLLGGVSTFCELWRSWHAKPDLSVVLGNSLEIGWNRQARLLSFTRWLTLRNDGEVTGVIGNPPRVRLGTSPIDAVDLTEIQVEEKGSAVGFPLSVHARDSRDVQITMSMTVPEGDGDFIKEGDYRLYLSVDTSSTPDAKVSCIRFQKSLIDAIAETGHLRNTTPDACVD